MKNIIYCVIVSALDLCGSVLVSSVKRLKAGYTIVIPYHSLHSLQHNITQHNIQYTMNGTHKKQNKTKTHIILYIKSYSEVTHLIVRHIVFISNSYHIEF